MKNKKPRNKKYNKSKLGQQRLHRAAENVCFHAWKSEETSEEMPVLHSDAPAKVFNHAIENNYRWHVLALTQCFDSNDQYYEEVQEVVTAAPCNINDLKFVVEGAMRETKRVVNPRDFFDCGFVCRVASKHVLKAVARKEQQEREAVLREKDARRRRLEKYKALLEVA
jgi:hypothetical protein